MKLPAAAVALALLLGSGLNATADPVMKSNRFPGPRYYVIPEDGPPATRANALHYVALAHRAMQSCVAARTAATEYRSALSALNAKHYNVAMATSRNIVDDCTGR